MSDAAVGFGLEAGYVLIATVNVKLVDYSKQQR